MSDSGSKFTNSESIFESDDKNNIHDFNDDDSFEIIKPLNHKGGMGELYKAKTKNGRILIVKRIKKEFIKNEKFIQLFKKEYDILKRLKNDAGIIEVFKFSKDEEGYYYSMEFIKGKTIEELIDFKELKDIEKIVKDLLSTLTFVHRKQIYHRDLKPSNIMFTETGNNIKILDFGLADSDSYEDKIKAMGSKNYISPEQKNGNETIDHRSDIYSFGIILLEMITKKTDLNYIKDVKSTTYKEVIRRSTFKEKEKRFESCSDILFFIEKLKIANKNFDDEKYSDAKKKYKIYLEENPNDDNQKFLEDRILYCKKQGKIKILYILIYIFSILLLINLIYILYKTF